MNARLQITGATYGGSLSASHEYDSYGYPASSSVGSIMGFQYNFDTDDSWLNNRCNTKHSGCYESFTYDNLERLDLVKDTLNNVLLDIDYAANGNITKKTDVSNISFGYNNSSKPYVLTDIEAVNNLISDTLQTVAYTSFEQPSSITENPYQAAFLYNSDDQRAKMTVTQGGNTILTRWYAGSRYMKETTGSVTKEYTYLGGDAYTAPVVAVTQSGTTTYYYLLRDYLGSVTHLVNTSNTVVAEYSYDAWGRRRVDDDWDNYNVSSEPDLFAGRGFTGHEYLPWFNLYNMNGRLYDPIAGRFLSPDENVQLADFTQGFNRYSYCLNNPLMYVDPDGEFPIAFLIGAIVGGYVGGSITNKDWSPWNGGWDWKDPETYFGITFGALAGGVGAQWMFGPEGVLSGKTMVDVSVGIDLPRLGTAFADFSFGQGAGLAFKGLGYMTVAGGGAYFTATMINNWANDKPNVSPEQKVDLAIAKAQTSVSAHNSSDENYIIGTSGTVYELEVYNGPKYIGGVAPIPGFAKGVKIIQYGGHTLEKGTLKILNLSKEKGKFAIESMKKTNRLPPNFHGNIGSDGSFWSKTGEYIDNILDYLY